MMIFESLVPPGGLTVTVKPSESGLLMMRLHTARGAPPALRAAADKPSVEALGGRVLAFLSEKHRETLERYSVRELRDRLALIPELAGLTRNDLEAALRHLQAVRAVSIPEGKGGRGCKRYITVERATL